ncbi:glycosyltransferase family 4 protein [Candidatus Woesearchaeota archaeon]|nr:glycosyltransferase family 4 protein [Candidatus Woesearchaeota archaeon]
MRVLMFGWEFPPYASGGLGTACHGLTHGLNNKGVEVTFVIPKGGSDLKADHVKLISADSLSNIRVATVNSILTPYISSEEYSEKLILLKSKKDPSAAMYGKNLYQEVYRYAKKAETIARHHPHDVIHCHDWMTYRAGINAKKVSKKPLVVHVHATEFDRTGNNPNQAVYDIEREGLHAADHIITVSNYTKKMVVQHYGINPDKVTVVHNAVEYRPVPKRAKRKHTKNVLFLGRITIQKGPEYFLYAAKKVLSKDRNVRFIVAGSGDMERFMIEEAARLGIADKVLFAGFLRGKKIDEAYRMADLYVMPSISEPFGITPLESLRNETPVLISKQSGVSEVLNNCLKVDFWDIDEMANKMLAVLNYKSLHSELTEQGHREVLGMNWDIPAERCIDVYRHTMGAA